MPLISQIVPDAEVLLALEPEEIGAVLLEYLNPMKESQLQNLHPHNLSISPDIVDGYPAEYADRISHAVMEGWAWLEREGLVARRPRSSGDWYFITRRGTKLRDRAGVEAYRKANLLPRELLHPALVAKVYTPFLRGDYDVAIFQAFKEVEVSVRSLGGLATTDLGVDLMRKAFGKDGPLADRSLPEAERESLVFLFWGGIGLYKNPQSNRNVGITDPTEAVEIAE